MGKSKTKVKSARTFSCLFGVEKKPVGACFTPTASFSSVDKIAEHLPGFPWLNPGCASRFLVKSFSEVIFKHRSRSYFYEYSITFKAQNKNSMLITSQKNIERLKDIDLHCGHNFSKFAAGEMVYLNRRDVRLLWIDPRLQTTYFQFLAILLPLSKCTYISWENSS